jgi:S-adenosylmethionine hydrolase
MKKLVFLFLLLVMLASFIGCAAPNCGNMPVVLLTDYGYDDYRVPRLKGIIYSAFPGVDIIDATHGIPSIDVAAGAYILDLAAKEFPSNVVFISGVGSPAKQDEQYLALLTNKGQYFVAANNGILTYIINEFGIKEVYSITNADLFDRPEDMLSSHYILGRIGAKLASGLPISDVGPKVNQPVMLDIQVASFADGVLKGTVVFTDHFGSCLTNITKADFDQLGLTVGDSMQVTIGETKVVLTLGVTYSSVAKGEAVAFVNSLGVLQLSLNAANFAAQNNCKNGTKFEIEKVK